MDGMTGGCLCGAVRYRISGEPQRRLCCHCRNCQRQSGGPMMAWAVVAEADFELLQGEPHWFGSSEVGRRAFCPDCGSALFFRREGRPAIRVVSAGSLDDFGDYAPEVHIWKERAVSWICLPEETVTGPGPSPPDPGPPG